MNTILTPGPKITHNTLFKNSYKIISRPDRYKRFITERYDIKITNFDESKKIYTPNSEKITKNDVEIVFKGKKLITVTASRHQL